MAGSMPRLLRARICAQFQKFMSQIAEELAASDVAPDCFFAASDYLEGYLQISSRATTPHDAPATPHDAQQPPDITLSEIEQNILTALGAQQMTARVIAERAGYQPHAYFRAILSGLVRRGCLQASRQGYRAVVGSRQDAKAPRADDLA